MEHVNAFIHVLSSVPSMQSAGFAMTDASIHILGDDILAEDAFAEFQGVAAFSLSGYRQRRNIARLRGWPRRLDLLNIPSRAQKVLDEFHEDHSDMVYINSLVDEKTKACQLVMDRHLMRKTSNIQHVEIAKMKNWKASKDQADCAQRHGTGLMQSQIVEDIIGHQKNDKTTKAFNCFKRPISAMTTALKADIITNRHHFKTVATDIPIAKKRRLTEDHFHPNKLHQSLPFENIANYEQKASYYNPKSENNGVRMGC